MRSAPFVFLAVLVGTVAHAQGRPPISGGINPCLDAADSIGRSATPVALLFAGLDRNDDARLTLAEMRDGIATQFGRADRDGNGDLGLAELAGWSRSWLGTDNARPGRFDFDRNADDRISRGEFEAELMRRFEALDTDHDRELSRAELLSVDPGRACAMVDADGKKQGRGKRQRRNDD